MGHYDEEHRVRHRLALAAPDHAVTRFHAHPRRSPHTHLKQVRATGAGVRWGRCGRGTSAHAARSAWARFGSSVRRCSARFGSSVRRCSARLGARRAALRRVWWRAGCDGRPVAAARSVVARCWRVRRPCGLAWQPRGPLLGSGRATAVPGPAAGRPGRPAVRRPAATVPARSRQSRPASSPRTDQLGHLTGPCPGPAGHLPGRGRPLHLARETRPGQRPTSARPGPLHDGAAREPARSTGRPPVPPRTGLSGQRAQALR